MSKHICNLDINCMFIIIIKQSTACKNLVSDIGLLASLVMNGEQLGQVQ